MVLRSLNAVSKLIRGMFMKKHCFFFVLLFALSVFSFECSASIAHPIPFMVHELLPEGVTGFDRVNEPVSFGIPLMDSDGIKDVGELGLTGASHYQFRPLHRYKSGNIQWVLVDTLASLSGGKVIHLNVTNGTGNSKGPDLARDTGTSITVDTGEAVFTLRKAHFNVFDSVRVGGFEYVERGGAITARSGEDVYSSIRDPLSTAVIEENGPVKAVVKCDGHLKDENGNWLFGYTMRIYFYRGTGRTRLDLILKNASYSSYSMKVFDSVQVEIPTTFSSPDFIFSTGPGEEEGAAVNGLAHLYQGFSSYKYLEYLGGVDTLKERLVPDNGLSVVNGAQVIRALGNEADHTEGWGAVSKGDKRINFGIRNLYGMWPAGFTLSDEGSISLDLYSPYNSKKDIKFAFFAHDKRQMILDFTTPEISPKHSFYSLQYPLFGRAHFSQYLRTKAIYGEDRMANDKEVRDFFALVGHGDFEISNVDTLRRYYYWGKGGGPNQYDLQLCKYIHFLRSGKSGAFLAALNDDHHKMFGSTPYSDDFNFYLEGVTYWPNSNRTFPENQGNEAFNTKFFDGEHSHDISVPIGYFLTGDESMIEAWAEYAEYTAYRHGTSIPDWSYYEGVFTRPTVRVMCRALRRLGALSQYLKEPSYYRSRARLMVRQIHRLRADRQDDMKDGWDLDRGFYYLSKDGSRPEFERWNKLFMANDIFPNSLWCYKSDVFDDPLYYEDYEDFMLGMAWHALDEVLDLVHQPYLFALDKANFYDEELTAEYPLTFLMSLGYEKTGNQHFLTAYQPHIKRLMNHQSAERGYTPYMSRFIDFYYHRDVVTGYVEPVGKGRVDMGNSSSPRMTRKGSSYTLNWTTPKDGIVSYQVKCAPVPMVERLHFDQMTRAFEYDPVAYDNFWASLNVEGEPIPASKAGTPETFAVDVAEVMALYNQRYELSEGDACYQSYDPGTDYYFAVKYVLRPNYLQELPCPAF